MDHRELYRQYSDEMDRINTYFQAHPYEKMSEEEFLITLSGVEVSKYKGLEVFPNGFKIRTSNNIMASFMEIGSYWRETTITEATEDGKVRRLGIGYTPRPVFSIFGNDWPYKEEERFYDDTGKWKNGDDKFLSNKCLREGLSFVENSKYLFVTEEDRKKALAAIGKVDSLETQGSDIQVAESQNNTQQAENTQVEILQPQGEEEYGKNLQEENPLEAMFHDHASPEVINALNTLSAAGIELSAEQKQIISRNNANNASKENPNGYTKR